MVSAVDPVSTPNRAAHLDSSEDLVAQAERINTPAYATAPKSDNGRPNSSAKEEDRILEHPVLAGQKTLPPVSFVTVR